MAKTRFLGGYSWGTVCWVSASEFRWDKPNFAAVIPAKASIQRRPSYLRKQAANVIPVVPAKAISRNTCHTCEGGPLMIPVIPAKAGIQYSINFGFLPTQEWQKPIAAGVTKIGKSLSFSFYFLLFTFHFLCYFALICLNFYKDVSCR